MTTYQVLHRVDGEMIIELEADSIYAVPTAVSGDGGMQDYVEALMRSKHTVCQIGQRCGRYNKLVRKDGKRGAFHYRRFHL